MYLLNINLENVCYFSYLFIIMNIYINEYFKLI